MPRIRQSASGSEYLTGSGFISQPPRVKIRELDDLPGSYSTVRRTGDPTRTGTLVSNFNDETTIIFSENADVNFPMMLPKSSFFASQAVDVIDQESDITASLTLRSFQQPNYLHYSPTENVGPFDENRAQPATEFFLSGTKSSVLPGYSSPLRSKVSFQIDITPNSETTFTRNLTSNNVAGGQPVGPTNTGFMYYNFVRREWEQIGITDPATGGTIYYDYDIGHYNPTSEYPSGSLPAQFSVSPTAPYAPDSEKEKLGYSKIGTPISAFGAPAREIYHATSSQCLKMSDYISSPFLLEAVRVEFEKVTAQRVQGDSIVIPGEGDEGTSDLYQSGAIKDIDNYVFFAYRQSRKNRIIDSTADISSSERYLMFSGSMTFWNSKTFESNRVRYENQEVGMSLTNTPAFSYDFGLPYSSSYDIRLTDWDPSHDTYYYNDLTFDYRSRYVAHFNFETTRDVLDYEPDKTGNGHIAQIDPFGISGKVNGPEYKDFPTSYLLGQNFFDSGAYISNRGNLDYRSLLTIDHAADLEMNRGSGFSISMWIKPSTLGTVQFVFAKSDLISDVEYGLLINAIDELEFRVYDSTSPDYLSKYLGVRTTSSVFTSTSDWKHVVVSYDGGYSNTSVKIFVNGFKLNQTSTTNGGVNTPAFSPKNASLPVHVGNRSILTLSYEGKIGSVEFFNVNIIESVARKLYRLQETPFLNSTQAMSASFTGSIDMQLTPAVCNRQAFGVSTYSNNKLQNVWLGGTLFDKFEKDNWQTANLVAPANPFVIDEGLFAAHAIDNSKFSPKLDSRASKFFGNDSDNAASPVQQLVSNIYVINDETVQSAISPYLLMPDDELVFGLDAGICSMPFLGGGEISNLTGSQLVIDSKTCRITLFGSLVQDSVEHLPSLNQDLSSNSVHEIIGAEPTLDQYQIENDSSYYGSYLDNIVTGSMASPDASGLTFTFFDQDNSRRVVNRISLGQAGTTGSLQRFIKVSDQNERTYDSCLPSYSEFFKDEPSVDVQLTSNVFGFNTDSHELVSFRGAEGQMFESGSFYSNQFPFQYNPKRRLLLRGTILSGTGIPLGSDNSSLLYPLGGDANTSAVDVTYRVGYTVESSFLGFSGRIEHRKLLTTLGPVPINKTPILGPFRYGISNTKSEFSSSRWRCDHFGHLRDMLEPRQVTATFDGVKPIKIRFVSGSNIIYDPLNTHAQNLSTFATSSMPYFDDGIARNRPDNPDETLVIAVTA